MRDLARFLVRTAIAGLMLFIWPLVRIMDWAISSPGERVIPGPFAFVREVLDSGSTRAGDRFA